MSGKGSNCVLDSEKGFCSVAYVPEQHLCFGMSSTVTHADNGADSLSIVDYEIVHLPWG